MLSSIFSSTTSRQISTSSSPFNDLFIFIHVPYTVIGNRKSLCRQVHSTWPCIAVHSTASNDLYVNTKWKFFTFWLVCRGIFFAICLENSSQMSRFLLPLRLPETSRTKGKTNNKPKYLLKMAFLAFVLKGILACLGTELAVVGRVFFIKLDFSSIIFAFGIAFLQGHSLKKHSS